MKRDKSGPSAVYTSGQVGRMCQVAARTVTKWYDAGLLTGYRIPGSRDRRIPRANLLRFMVAHGLPLDLVPDLRPEELAAAQEKTADQAQGVLT